MGMEEATMKTIRVSEKGQIAIPIEMRERLGIKKGDELIIVRDKGKMLIEKARKVAEEIKDNFGDIKAFTEHSLKEVWDNSEDEIWSSYIKK